jgi:hypothetical protein
MCKFICPVYITSCKPPKERKMSENHKEIEIELQMRSTAELDESVKSDLEQEDKSLASLFEEEGEDEAT